MRTRKVGQVAAALASALLIVGVFVGQAGANHCNGCIDKADIARNAVGSPELVNGGVQAEDIDTGAVRTGDIKNQTILPKDLAAKARTRVGVVELAGATDDTTDTLELDAFTVTVPAAGTLVVIVQGNYWINGDSTTTTGADGIVNEATIGLCTATATLSSLACGDTQSLFDSDADGNDSTNNAPAYSLVRSFSVTAGARTFYVNGAAGAVNDPLEIGEGCCGPTYATVLFTPGSLNVTSD